MFAVRVPPSESSPSPEETRLPRESDFIISSASLFSPESTLSSILTEPVLEDILSNTVTMLSDASGSVSPLISHLFFANISDNGSMYLAM